MVSKVLLYIKQNKEVSVADICVNCNIQRDMAEAILYMLEQKGIIERQVYTAKKCACNCGGCYSGMCCQNIVVFRLK
ncbi:MAG: FeoC-like transcriptional regulator [Spirochaetes bacterium]|nr:FeoC-like transcriptional regulator [Spirochaetota bacterium]